MNLPPDYPINDYRIGFEWSSPWRYKRLWEVLAEQDQHTMQNSLDLQRDYHSVLARRVLALLPKLEDYPGGGLLSGWNYEMKPDSPAAALWNIWYTRHLAPVLGAFLAKDAESPSVALDPLTLLDVLTKPRARTVAYASLQGAFQETESLLGTDPKKWQWGDLHRIKFQHPLLAQATGKLHKDMRMTDYPRGGNANTTNNTGFRGQGFDVASGASFRMVVDVGNWDNAFATNAPGQSGDPRSKFYDNLLDNWASDDSFPLLYSRTAIEKNGAFSITLLPGK